MNTGCRHGGQRQARLGIPLGSGLTKPVTGLIQIATHARSALIQQAKIVLAFHHPAVGRFSEPLSGAVQILRTTLAPEIEDTQIMHRLPITVLGGQAAWAIGEFPLLIVAIALAVQWSRSDERDARRMDRQADRDGGQELASYNAYLAQLNSRATARDRSSNPEAPQ